MDKCLAKLKSLDARHVCRIGSYRAVLLADNTGLKTKPINLWKKDLFISEKIRDLKEFGDSLKSKWKLIYFPNRPKTVHFFIESFRWTRISFHRTDRRFFDVIISIKMFDSVPNWKILCLFETNFLFELHLSWNSFSLNFPIWTEFSFFKSFNSWLNRR